MKQSMKKQSGYWVLGLCLLTYNTFLHADAFLKHNAGEPGVITTDSGLQYKVVQEGTGLSPGPKDMVTVHYRGQLTSGEVFDSSKERNQPLSFALNRVIPGWTQGLQTMKEGGTTLLYIPAHLGYGDRSVGKIPANATLVFEVDLLKVKTLNLPETKQEVLAFTPSVMDCPAPPTLPDDPKKLGQIHDQATAYINCARDYYQLESMRLEGLVELASKDESLRDVVVQRIQAAQKQMEQYLNPATKFIQAYSQQTQAP